MDKALFGLLITLGVNALFFLIGICLFALYRKYRSPRAKDSPLNGPPFLEERLSFIEAMAKTISLSSEETLFYCKDEGYLYLMLIRSLAIALSLMSVINISFLTPSYYYADMQRTDDKYSRFSIDAVTGFADQMVTPAITVLVFSAVVYFMYFQTLRNYQNYKEIMQFNHYMPSVKSVVLQVSSIPKHLTPKTLTSNLQSELDTLFPKSVFSVYVVPDLTKLYVLYKKKEEIENTLERYKALTYEDYRPTVRPKLCAKTVDAVLHFEKELIKVEWEIDSLKETAVETSLGLAFVICNSPRLANLVVQNYKGKDGKIIEKAPEASDLVWENLGTLNMASTLKYMILNVMFILVFFVFLTPLTMSKVLSSFVESLELHSTFSAFLSVSVPSIVLSIFQSVVIPLSIGFLVTQENHARYSEQAASIINKFQGYLLVNLILFPLLGAVTLTMMIGKLTKVDILEWNVLMSRNVAAVSEVYISLMVSMIFLSNFLDLFAVHKFFKGKFHQWKAVTETESHEAAQAPRFEFSFEYCKVLSMFALTLIFSIAMPLIVPLGCFYIWLKYLVDKYNLLFVYRVDNKPVDKVQHTLGKFLMFILALFQLVNSGLFAVSGEQAYFLFGGMLTTIAVMTFSITFFIGKLYVFESEDEVNDFVLGTASVLYKHPCDQD